MRTKVHEPCMGMIVYLTPRSHGFSSKLKILVTLRAKIAYAQRFMQVSQYISLTIEIENIDNY